MDMPSMISSKTSALSWNEISALRNAGVQPNAMMVVVHNAFIAAPAMLSVRRTFYIDYTLELGKDGKSHLL
ncbi:unnamed protein product [Gordionus sp. m RMFG-2023]